MFAMKIAQNKFTLRLMEGIKIQNHMELIPRSKCLTVLPQFIACVRVCCVCVGFH